MILEDCTFTADVVLIGWAMNFASKLLLCAFDSWVQSWLVNLIFDAVAAALDLDDDDDLLDDDDDGDDDDGDGDDEYSVSEDF